jgi:histidyl-tRNA synthetase
VDYLRDVGLTPDDIVVKISSRKMLAAVLKEIGVGQKNLDSLYAVLDKKNRLPAETFEKVLNEQLPDSMMAGKVREFMEIETISQVENMFGCQEAFDELAILFDWLNRMNVGDYCKFDPGVVRGLAYYTGVVFEVYGKASQLRAIGGGGRYDNLLQDFGGPAIAATGMGMGDCVLEILLEGKGLLQKQLPKAELDFFVIYTDKQFSKKAVEITAKLRRLGAATNFSYKSAGLSKQLKEASSANAKKCIIIGDEYRDGKLIVKDMATGRQELVMVDRFLSQPKS